MTARLGSALVLIGVITLLVFLLGLSVQQGDVRALLLGAGLAALGLILRRRAARADQPTAARFRALRRLLGQVTEEEDEG